MKKIVFSVLGLIYNALAIFWVNLSFVSDEIASSEGETAYHNFYISPILLYSLSGLSIILILLYYFKKKLGWIFAFSLLLPTFILIYLFFDGIR